MVRLLFCIACFSGHFYIHVSWMAPLPWYNREGAFYFTAIVHQKTFREHFSKSVWSTTMNCRSRCDVSRLEKSLLAVCSTAINLDGEQETTWINWSLNFPLEVHHSDCVLNRPGKSDKGDVRERNSQHIHEIMTQRIYNVSRRCMNVASVPFTCTINFTPCSSE